MYLAEGQKKGLALAQAGIAFEVVCGISSAIGGLAYAGFRLLIEDIPMGFAYIPHIHKKMSLPI